MQKLLTVLLITQFVFSFAQAQQGCTDPQATNYNVSATINDGSCVYPSTSLPLTLNTNLATPQLDENSGIVQISGEVWLHNDGGNNNEIYRVDTVTGAILQTVSITNATNIDWEDITLSATHLYIGDFGNNYGNRPDLRIYKILLADLIPTATVVLAEVIDYTYPDQTSFTSTLNNTNYDCEAMLFYNDSLHLFSKNWVDKKTKHYILPALQGTYTATLADSLDVTCLITGAAVQEHGVITLVGYDNTGLGPIYMWMLFDFNGSSFFSGNKRKFTLSNAITNGQIEAVYIKTNGTGFVTNERFQQSIINVSPKLKSFTLFPYLPAAYTSTPMNVPFLISGSELLFSAFPSLFNDQITFRLNNWPEWPVTFTLSDSSGKIISQQLIEEKTDEIIYRARLSDGIYIVVFQSQSIQQQAKLSRTSK